MSYTVKDLLNDLKDIPLEYKITDWSDGNIKDIKGLVIVCDDSKSVALSTDSYEEHSLTKNIFKLVRDDK